MENFMEIHSGHLKTALLAYYRFRNRNICADEVFNADVLVDNGKQIIEVECKISKSDLKADIKKEKHKLWKQEPLTRHYIPNKFYICVPTELVDEALKWTEENNSNYGVIEFSRNKFESKIYYQRGWHEMLYFRKKAKKLHDEYRGKIKDIALRLCSIHINNLIGNIKSYESK